MADAPFPTILAVFFVVWLIFLWISARKARAYKPSTHLQYLWRLKEITDKSEYQLFQIAAKEKGGSVDHVERDFKQYLQDQSLPVYVKAFLADGEAYILSHRPAGGDVFDKKLVVFYIIMGLILIGGTLVICLYLFPEVWPGQPDG